MIKNIALGLLALALAASCTEKKETERKVFAKNEFKEWAQTPPMGWNSWDCYGPTVEEHEGNMVGNMWLLIFAGL